MKSREETVKFINDGTGYETVKSRNKGSQWHFGKQDLRELLDFIYEGEPEKETEKITSI